MIVDHTSELKEAYCNTRSGLRAILEVAPNVECITVKEGAVATNLGLGVLPALPTLEDSNAIRGRGSSVEARHSKAGTNKPKP